MYDPLDEDERRRQRDNELAPDNPGIGGYDPPPGTPAPTDDFMLWPEAPPKTEAPTVTTKSVDTTPRPTATTPPAPPGSQPTFQPAAAPALSAPSPASAPAALPRPAITDEVTRILMARLKALENPQDLENDPAYQQAVRTYQVGQLRSAARQRNSLAERTAATGGTTSSGGFNVNVRGIEERAGENAAQYRSGLALDRLQAREAQLADAIKTARAVGQDEIANALELQRLQLQQELGQGDLALRSELGRGQLELGRDNLGLSYADLVTRANRDAVLAGL